MEMSVDLWTMENVVNIQCCQFSVPIPNWPMSRLLREIDNWQHYHIGNIYSVSSEFGSRRKSKRPIYAMPVSS